MPLFINPIPPAIIADDGAYQVGTLTITLVANTLYLRAFVVNAPTVIVAAGYRMGATTTGKSNMGIYSFSLPCREALFLALIPGKSPMSQAAT